MSCSPNSCASCANSLHRYLKPGNPQLCGNAPVSNSLIICNVSEGNGTTSFNPFSDCQPLGFLGQACASDALDPQHVLPGDKLLPLFLDLLFNSSVRFDFQQREHDSLVKALSIAMPGAANDGIIVLSPVVNATDPFALTRTPGRVQGRRLLVHGSVARRSSRRLLQASQPPTYQQLVAATVTARSNVTAQQLQQQLDSAVRSGELRQLLLQEPGWEGLLGVDLATQQSFLGPGVAVSNGMHRHVPLSPVGCWFALVLLGVAPLSCTLATGTAPATAPTPASTSSDNTVAIAVGVAVPCAVLAAVAIVGAALWVRRVRHSAQSTAPLASEASKGGTNDSDSIRCGIDW